VAATTFTLADDLEPLVLIGGVAAFAAAALTVAWLVVMVTMRSPQAGSTADEELAFIAANDGAQIAKFLPTTLVAFAYVPTWLGLGVLLWEEAPAAGGLAVAFGLLYPATTATGYWMQYTVVRGLAGLAATDEVAARSAYEIVGFHDRPTSMGASAVVLGYTLWSFGGVAAGVGLVAHGGGHAVTTGVLFLVTAALMFLGVIGHIARNRVLNLGIFLSGVTSLGATIATALLLISQV
jgi:hypothetical protein